MVTYDTILLNIYYVAYLLPIYVFHFIETMQKIFIDIINKIGIMIYIHQKDIIRCNGQFAKTIKGYPR